MLKIDALVMESMLRATIDYKHFTSLGKNALELVKKQIEREIRGLELIPEEKDALTEAQALLKRIDNRLE